MAGRTGTPRDRVDDWLTHAAALILWDSFLVVGRPGGLMHCELIAKNCEVTAPAPGRDGSEEVLNGVTGEVRLLQQQVIQVVHAEGDEEVVEIRRGTRGTQ